MAPPRLAPAPPPADKRRPDSLSTEDLDHNLHRRAADQSDTSCTWRKSLGMPGGQGRPLQGADRPLKASPSEASGRSPHAEAGPQRQKAPACPCLTKSDRYCRYCRSCRAATRASGPVPQNPLVG
eukprot:scaffold38966_cov47-Phaeocystis_antarctica.AAC.2